MESVNIEQLLEAYFEGNTTLTQEQELRTFFSSSEIPPHLAMYQPMFQSFDLAKEETSQREITIFESKKRSRFWNYSIAASLLIAIGVTGYMISQPGLTSEEAEAIAAFKQTKEIMFLFSENLNDGTSSIAHLDEFRKGVSNLSVINQFNESKNLILK
jgi:hypothetical protein